MTQFAMLIFNIRASGTGIAHGHPETLEEDQELTDVSTLKGLIQ
jgi:hypothetical protein